MLLLLFRTSVAAGRPRDGDGIGTNFDKIVPLSIVSRIFGSFRGKFLILCYVDYVGAVIAEKLNVRTRLRTPNVQIFSLERGRKIEKFWECINKWKLCCYLVRSRVNGCLLVDSSSEEIN